MTTSEFKVKQKIKLALRKAQDLHPTLYWKSLSERYNSGIPDFFVAHKGQVLFIEAKAIKGRVSKIQDHEMSALQKAGVASVVWSYDKEGLLNLKPIYMAKPETLDFIKLICGDSNG